MEEIRKGLRDNLDISVYAKPEYNYNQMNFIYLGLKDNLDISKYADPKLSWEEMLEIVRELKK